MINDLIVNWKPYGAGLNSMSKAFSFIKKLGSHPKDGRYAINGDKMYAIVSSYRTKEDTALPFEAHRKYVDVQCILNGEERIDVAQGSKFRVKNRYNSEKDVLFIHPPKIYSSIILTPGSFALFYPQDYHRPCRCVNSPENVRKLVIKIFVPFAIPNL